MVRTGPWLGLLGQAGLLAVLALAFTPAWPGLIVGATYGVLVAALLAHGLAGARRFGPANVVTSARAVMVGGVAVLVVGSFTRPLSVWPLIGLSTIALVLDNVDGRVARSTGTSSAIGARFDLEVDAFLILLLSIAVSPTTGWWVLLIGAARYLLALGGFLFEWLAQPSPPRYWCKVVAAIQGVVLTVAVSGVLPHLIMVAAVAISLALLVESFGREIAWKWQHRRQVTSSPSVLSPRVLRPRRSPGYSRASDRHRMPCPNAPRRHLHGQG